MDNLEEFDQHYARVRFNYYDDILGAVSFLPSEFEFERSIMKDMFLEKSESSVSKKKKILEKELNESFKKNLMNDFDKAITIILKNIQLDGWYSKEYIKALTVLKKIVDMSLTQETKVLRNAIRFKMIALFSYNPTEKQQLVLNIIDNMKTISFKIGKVGDKINSNEFKEFDIYYAKEAFRKIVKAFDELYKDRYIDKSIESILFNLEEISLYVQSGIDLEEYSKSIDNWKDYRINHRTIDRIPRSFLGAERYIYKLVDEITEDFTKGKETNIAPYINILRKDLERVYSEGFQGLIYGAISVITKNIGEERDADFARAVGKLKKAIKVASSQKETQAAYYEIVRNLRHETRNSSDERKKLVKEFVMDLVNGKKETKKETKKEEVSSKDIEHLILGIDKSYRNLAFEKNVMPGVMSGRTYLGHRNTYSKEEVSDMVILLNKFNKFTKVVPYDKMKGIFDKQQKQLENLPIHKIKGTKGIWAYLYHIMGSMITNSAIEKGKLPKSKKKNTDEMIKKVREEFRNVYKMDDNHSEGGVIRERPAIDTIRRKESSVDEAEKMIRSAMGAKYYNTVHTNELFFILIDHTFNEMEDNLKLSTYFYNMIKKIAKEETSKYSSKKF
jgi:hypothetical protein